MRETFSLLWEIWDLYLGIPLWFHAVFSIPLGIFLVFQMVQLIGGIWEGPKKSERREEVGIKKEENLGISSLVSAMVSTVVGVSLLPTILEAVEEVATMPNQLIQKKDRPNLVEKKELPPILYQTEKKLREGFERVHSEVGLKHLSKLEAEYRGLRSILDSSKIEDTVLNIGRISKLTSELYQQGLNFLTQALNVANQLTTSSREDLVAESKELGAELSKSSPGSTVYKMVTERLASNNRSLGTIKGFNEKLDEYFCQVGLCRDSIREIRLGIPELVGNIPKDEFNKIILELRTRVELAQRVQAEYTRQGI